MKNQISTSYNHPPVKVSPSGTGIEPVYQWIKNEKTGVLEHKKVGETNVYAFIQENAKLCGLDLLIAQLKAGDTSGLVKSGGLYADEKDLPKTIHDAKEKSYQMIEKWRNNPILKSIYKTPEDYIDDLFKGEVINKVNKYYRDETEKNKKMAEDALKAPKKEVGEDKISPKVEPKIENTKTEVK